MLPSVTSSMPPGSSSATEIESAAEAASASSSAAAAAATPGGSSRPTADMQMCWRSPLALAEVGRVSKQAAGAKYRVRADKPES